MMSIVVSTSLVTDDPGHLSVAAEKFSRAAIELGLLGIDVTVSIATVPDDEEPDAEPVIVQACGRQQEAKPGMAPYRCTEWRGHGGDHRAEVHGRLAAIWPSDG